MKKEYEKIKAEVENFLEVFFNDEIKRASLISPYSREAIELIKEYTLRGGKRIRAILVYCGYRCFKNDNKNTKDIIKIAAAVEVIQSYLLIHDDFVDQDNLRRGGPTVHKKYEKKYQNFENRWHFGASMAIFLGDISCSLANRIICQTNLDEKLKVNLIHNLSKTLNEVCHGEILDIISNYRELDEKEILKIHELKTASYTIEGPLMMGATIADAEESDIKKLKQYAMLVGKAFQLQDDILGIYGNEEELGKNIGSDLREGKITLLIKKTLQKADKKQEKYIRNLLKNKKISKAEIEKIKKIIEGSGALRETKELSRKMVSEAKKIIEKTHFNKEAKEFLTKLADYVIEREK